MLRSVWLAAKFSSRAFQMLFWSYLLRSFRFLSWPFHLTQSLKSLHPFPQKLFLSRFATTPPPPKSTLSNPSTVTRHSLGPISRCQPSPPAYILLLSIAFKSLPTSSQPGIQLFAHERHHRTTASRTEYHDLYRLSCHHVLLLSILHPNRT